MTRRRQGIRIVGAVTVALLLWCHGLDVSFYGHVSAAPQQAGMAETIAPPSHAHPDFPEVSCCFGGAGTNLLKASLTRAPALPLPWLAALLSTMLFIALPLPGRTARRHYAAHRASLVEQSVLIRI